MLCIIRWRPLGPCPAHHATPRVTTHQPSHPKSHLKLMAAAPFLLKLTEVESSPGNTTPAQRSVYLNQGSGITLKAISRTVSLPLRKAGIGDFNN